MEAAGNIRIAGDKTIDDWKNLRAKLEIGASKDRWKEAGEFLKTRLETRYMEPIRAIQCKKRADGSGFAIVTIQCMLIEFLASLQEGKNYKHRGPDSSTEYSRSSDIYKCFLTSQASIVDPCCENDAQNFYSNVRCPLLHEARTQGGWRIRTDGEKAIDFEKKIVDRNKLLCALDAWLAAYFERLTTDEETQENFIRKLDHLASD